MEVHHAGAIIQGLDTKGVCKNTSRTGDVFPTKMTLTLTLSRPTGEGTARTVASCLHRGWKRRPTEDDSPSPIRPRLRRRLRRGEWERAGPSPRRSGFVRAGGVRVSVPQNRKLFLHEP